MKFKHEKYIEKKRDNNWCLIIWGEYKHQLRFLENLAENFPRIKLENCEKLIQYNIYILEIVLLLTNNNVLFKWIFRYT